MNRYLFAAAMLATSVACGNDAASEVQVGRAAPDFSVTGIDGKAFKLSDKTKAGKNVALMFSRAHW
jgi:hypothetical protein